MVENINLDYNQLKDICRLTHSRWVCWFEKIQLFEGAGNKIDWTLPSSSYGLNKSKEALLSNLINRPKVSTWMAGALSTGRMRSRNLGDLKECLSCERIFIFPNQEAQKLLVVGADVLTPTGKGFFKVLARGVRSDHPVLNLSDDILNSFLYDMESDGSYDLRRILNRVISVLVGHIHCDIACLGIRQGDTFRLEAAWGYPDRQLGKIVDIEDNAELIKVVETRSSVIVNNIQIGGACPMVSEFGGESGSWIGVPIVVGKRVIGAVCFLSHKNDLYDQSVIRLADTLVEQIAPSIETIVTFAEISRHLGKQALLNELASAVAIGIDIEEVSQRIVGRLRRVFHTNYVAVLLPSSDKKYLREYGEKVYQTSHLMVPYDRSLAGHVIETGQPMRIGDLSKSSEWEGLSPQARSELSVPLKFRGNVIGVLDIESTEPDAFTRRDEIL
jgi:putative methionine-R-sulfoxide reductase with GAF domain